MAGFIKCPQCKTEIPLNEVIDHEIGEQLERRLAGELKEREHAHAEALGARERELRAEFEEQREERDEELRERAERKVAAKLADLEQLAEERSEELQKAQERELKLRNERRKLEEEREALELEVARRVDGERKKIAVKAREELAEGHQLALREKEIELEQMQRQIKDLQDSAQQRSSGLRGEALEREIEVVLRERFPHDRIDPIKAGTRGADVLQTVNHRGTGCGKILWESKRARNFSSTWITKLKQDQAASNADFAVLVCATLPPNVRLMEQMDGVWVIDATCVPALASALRDTLALVAQTRSVDINRNEAMDAIYQYLSSNAFALRLRGGVETVVEMKQELEVERRAFERRWTKRASQLDQLVLNAAGMYGELEALMGSALPSVELLELPMPAELEVAPRPAA
jgi:hypothetical protein